MDAMKRRRPNRLDWLVYRLFRRRWNGIMSDPSNVDLCAALAWDIHLWHRGPGRTRDELESLIKRPRKDI